MGVNINLKMNVCKLFLILTVCLLPFRGMAEEVYTNGAFYVQHAANIKYLTMMVGEPNKTNDLISGKTYSFGLELFEFKTTDKPVEMYFSNGSLIRVYPNSEFVLNTFDQVVTNLDAQPELLRVGTDNLGVSLMEGSMDIISVSSNNSPITFQTPLATFGLLTGKYHVEVDRKTDRVVTYVLEGDLIVYDNVTTKEEVVSAGTGKAVIAFPMPTLNRLVTSSSSDKVMVDVKKVKPADNTEMLNTANTLQKIKDLIKFFVVDGKIVGIKIS